MVCVHCVVIKWEERCIACKLCGSLVCPAMAITIESRSNAKMARAAPRVSDIDLTKCIFCGFCEESCPVDSIVETHVLEYHGEKRGDLYFTKRCCSLLVTVTNLKLRQHVKLTRNTAKQEESFMDFTTVFILCVRCHFCIGCNSSDHCAFPVHAALFLVLSFFSAASIWMLLKTSSWRLCWFLVYVGAVMVLFLLW